MSKQVLFYATGLAILVGCLPASAAMRSQPPVESGFMAEPVSEISGIRDPLPDLQVSAVSVKNASAFDALRLVLEHSGGGIGLTYIGNGGVPASLRRPVAANNLEGKLPALVEQLAKVAGFYYRYDPSSKVLSVYQEQQFVAYATDQTVLPSLKAQIAKLGAKDLAEDPILGALSYRAGRQDQERIQQYIDTMHSANVRRDGADTVSARIADPEFGSRPAKIWTIQLQDGYVSSALKRWGQESGWQVVWDAPKDFPIAAAASFSGKFESAVESLVDSLSSTDAPMQAYFYPNKVVRISRFNGQTSDLRR